MLFREQQLRLDLQTALFLGSSQRRSKGVIGHINPGKAQQQALSAQKDTVYFLWLGEAWGMTRHGLFFWARCAPRSLDPALSSQPWAKIWSVPPSRDSSANVMSILHMQDGPAKHTNSIN